ncbi:MAG: gamma-glutamyl-gamma-aminobutyrate hydrolase family protein [Candidatus Marinimicrobia bacterium]|nr:gamma-glutamyl-gamma-aminobutyrate hydrolase family protein [Candidatus Neomarinimicrobiota bacterium]
MGRQRPLIGIVISPPEDGSSYYNLNPQYADAVWRAGGAPLAIPLNPEPDFADQISATIQGLLLTGSKYDMDPQRYGEMPHPRAGEVHANRDAMDRLLLERAFDLRLPVLGVCHGCQAINVARGGSIVQDIVDEIGPEIDHRMPSGAGEYAHEVTLEPQSALNESSEASRAMTNSAHHQSINRVGAGLKVIACSSDGVIEAVEGATMADHFILGLQWHPERLAASDALHFRPFQALVAAAELRSNQ